ncbi:MAG TPA: rhomboid family intramembrane serine protease [Bacteroidia bacterium]|nr:rhomboid family intramembrane serine protease [Bacteroidia bacterium]
MATSFRDELRNTFRSGDTLNILLLLNVGVFLVIRIIDAVLGLFMVSYFGSETLVSYLAVPASPDNLLWKPWTLITYQFLHYDFLHILFNLLWLFWMGKIFVEYLGMKKLLSVYILGGIAGAILFIIAYNLFPLFGSTVSQAQALGASASVLAITVAIAVFVPDYTIHLLLIGPVRLKYLALVTILLDIISISGSNAGGHIAHLGGAIFGFVYASNLKKGINIAQWFETFAQWLKSLPGKRKMKVVKKARPLSDEDFLHNKKVTQEKIDDILEKISRSGYGSLTSEERDMLFNFSNTKNSDVN